MHGDLNDFQSGGRPPS